MSTRHATRVVPTIALFLASLACGGGGGGSCSAGGEVCFLCFGPPPTPTPQIVEGPDGGRVYVLLDGPAGTSLEIVQVATDAVVGHASLATVTSATAFAIVRETELLFVADAERRGIVLTDFGGEEVGFLPTEWRPVDLAYLERFRTIFIATTSAFLSIGEGAGDVDVLDEYGAFTSVDALEADFTTDEGDTVFDPAAVATRVTEDGGSLVLWNDGYPIDVPIESSDCIARPDATAAVSIEDFEVFAADDACDRLYSVGGGTPLGSSTSGHPNANPNRMVWRPEAENLAILDGERLLFVRSDLSEVSAVAAIPRGTALTGSIDGRTLWAGSTAPDAFTQPALHRFAHQSVTSLLVGSAGDSIVDIRYLDRPPTIAGPTYGLGVLPATPGRLGYYEIEAIDADGDAVDVGVFGPLPDWVRFDDELHALTWIYPCDGVAPEDATITVTATAGRYRVQRKIYFQKTGDPACD